LFAYLFSFSYYFYITYFLAPKDNW
jgi:hypothetical protein